jgi:hypothetical protein
MHGASLSRPQRGTRRAQTRSSLRTRTLKNRLPGHGTAGGWTHDAWSAGLSCRNGSSGPRRRCLVDRTWSSLRNDHTRCGRCGRSRRRGARHDRLSRRCGWCSRSGRCHRRRGRNGRSSSRGLSHCRTRGRRDSCGRRSWSRRRRDRGFFDNRYHRARGWRGCDWRRYRCRRRRWRWRSHRFRDRRCNCRLCCDSRNGRFRRRRCCGFLLLRNRAQHIARSGDVRQINLGLDFFFAAKRTR